MTSQYLAGELSVRLGRLQAAVSADRAAEGGELRHRVQTRPPASLAEAMRRAVALADDVCWDSLSHGDASSFARQASVSADLRQFGICARLLTDDQPAGRRAEGSGDG